MAFAAGCLLILFEAVLKCLLTAIQGPLGLGLVVQGCLFVGPGPLLVGPKAAFCRCLFFDVFCSFLCIVYTTNHHRQLTFNSEKCGQK